MTHPVATTNVYSTTTGKLLGTLRRQTAQFIIFVCASKTTPTGRMVRRISKANGRVGE